MDPQGHLVALLDLDHGYREKTVTIAIVPPALGISQDSTTKKGIVKYNIHRVCIHTAHQAVPFPLGIAVFRLQAEHHG